MTDWRKKHGEIIVSFMEYLNAKTDAYILKGGTALYLCYNLDRFSEDIDLDGKEKGLMPLVEAYCAESGYTHRAAKDTAMVERCFINYGNNSHPLKIEASYRRSTIPSIEVETINSIRVYGIEPLCVMKTTAYAGRDKIRDLYDIAFICNNYYDRLTPPTVALLRNAVEHKGIEQFDYVVRNQPDDLIDNEKLAEDFLRMYERLGLLLDENERKLLTQNANNGANGVHF